MEYSFYKDIYNEIVDVNISKRTSVFFFETISKLKVYL